MATILKFAANQQVSTSEACASRRPTTCEVVIFPGVRYERASEPECEEPQRAVRTRRERDYLDLVD
jgi:hypothetical protein